MRSAVATAVAGLIAGVFGASGSGVSGLGVPAAHAAPDAEWTLMVYLAADNDLEPFALTDLNELEAGMPDNGIEVLVLMDRAAGYDDGDGDWTGTRLYRVRPDIDPDHIASELVEDLGEVNSAAPATLARFIGKTVADYPARRYGLVFWDHGGGWAGMAVDEDTGGGQSGKDLMTMPELRQGLEDGLKAANLKSIDLVGFDMCLMGQFEVAYEIAGLADYMVASQAVEPGDGWKYDLLLPAFASATTGPRRLASHIVESFAQGYRHADASERDTLTLSALDLGTMPELRAAFDALVAGLAPAVADNYADISRSLFWAAGYAPDGKRGDLRAGKSALASIDVIDALKRLRVAMGDRFPAEPQFRAFIEAYDRANLANHAGLRYRLSAGLSIYAPVASGNFDPAYRETRFAGDSPWPDLLEALHSRQTEMAAAPKIAEMAFVNAVTDERHQEMTLMGDTVLRLRIEGDDILWVSSLAGRLDRQENGVRVDAISFLMDTRNAMARAETVGEFAELLVPTFTKGGAELEMDVSGITLVVSDGRDAVMPTLDMTSGGLSSSGLPVVTARALLRREGVEQAEVAILFDMRNWKAAAVQLMTTLPDGRVVPRTIRPRPDDRLTFLHLFLPKEGKPEWRPGETLAWGDGLELLMDIVPTGDYVVTAEAEAIGGLSQTQARTVTMAPPPEVAMALVEGGRRIAVTDLLGEWSMDDGEGPVFRLVGLPATRSLARVEFPPGVMPGGAGKAVFDQVIATVDTRRLPTLFLNYVDVAGEIVAREYFLLLAHPRDAGSIMLRSFIGSDDDARGSLVRLIRTQGTSPQPGPGPAAGGPTGPSQVAQNTPPPAGPGGPAPGAQGQPPVQPPVQQAPAVNLPPPLPPPEQPVQYYVEHNGRPAGPFALQQIVQMIAAGQLTRESLLWKQGTAAWGPLDQFDELRPALSQAAPPAIPDEQRLRRFFVGVWTITVPMPGDVPARRTATVRYNPDGTFNGVISVEMDGMAQVGSFPLAGTYSIAAMGPDRFSLTIREQQSGSSSTAVLRIIDRNTLENETLKARAHRLVQ